jgi:hypothetical protein
MDESVVTKAQNSDTVAGDAGLFCVIGPTVNSTFGRTWKRGLEDAVKHGKKIIAQSYDRGPKVKKLYVVQVVQVLEVDDKPPISVRGVTADDTDQEDD